MPRRRRSSRVVRAFECAAVALRLTPRNRAKACGWMRRPARREWVFVEYVGRPVIIGAARN